MKIALLGSDDESIALVRAARCAGHELIWWGDVLPEHLAELGVEQPSFDDWEILLDDQFCDSVIVGRGAASAGLRLEQLQKLIGNEIPVLITQLPVDSVLPFHELDMLRREKRSLVQRYHPEIEHSWMPQLAEICRSGNSQLGAIHQIALERGLSSAHRESIIATLARDVEFLEYLAGTLVSVSAFSAGGDETALRGLSVQFIGEREIPVRWSIAPNESSRLVLIGERQRLVVELASYPAAWSVDDPTISLENSGAFDPAHDAIEHFTASIAAIDRGESAEAYSTWDDATRAMEVVDVVELSLHKGRTIEVHHQQLTEDLAFRGTMSALGCGLLLTVLFGLVLVGIFGDIFGLPLRGVWPILLLGGLGLFLLVQLVPKFFPPRDS